MLPCICTIVSILYRFRAQVMVCGPNKICSLARHCQAEATTAAVRLVMPFAVALIMSCSSTRNATTRCTLHNPPKALPAVRTNHLGIDSCYGNASRSSATPAAQHRCTLDRACVKLAMTVVTLCTVAMILMMTSCCPPADSYEIHIVLGATTEVLTVAPHWTAREVTAALEAKTGRSLRGCWLLAPGAKVLRVGKKKARTLGELGVGKGSVLEVRLRVHGGMGCAGSKAVDTRDVQLQEEKNSGSAGAPGPAPAPATAPATAPEPAATSATALEFKMPDFEYSTPMLVMPFLQFKAQGRIMKSVQKWRDEALAQGWLVEFKEGEGKVAIFISHTWWDRDFKDETNDASDVYDKGSPDWQSGEKKNLKWRVICAGVERLIEEKGLEAENVMIWCDWQSSAPHRSSNPGPADQRLACR